MKKFALILLVLSLARVGVAFADTTTASSSAVTGLETGVLTGDQLLYWVKGEPGQDGLNGLNGVDGATGATGATGAQGESGTSVTTTAFTGSGGPCTNGGIRINAVSGATYLCNGTSGAGVSSVLFTGTRGTCNNGGVEFTDGLGNKSLACNGTNGANGANGATGATGAAGATTISSSDTSTSTIGDGQVVARACDTDGAVKVDIDREFDGTDFFFSAFSFGDANATTNGDLDAGCLNKPITIYISIDPTLSLSNSRVYQRRDTIVCNSTINAISNSNPQYVMDSSTSCYVRTRASATTSDLTAASITAPAYGSGNTFTLNRISTADFVGNIGFTIGR
jgi:hypothetical protein